MRFRMVPRTLVLLAAPIVVPALLLAQGATRPEYDLVTIGGRFGGLSGARDPDQANVTSWRLGWAASADVTVWVHEYVGLRASGTWGQARIKGTWPALGGRQKLNKFSYDGDVVLRYPVAVAGTPGWVAPYAFGGAGAVTLHQLDSDETFTKFAGTFGVGVEYRYKRVGFKVEGRDVIFLLDRFGFDRTQHDIVWDGGITVSF